MLGMAKRCCIALLSHSKADTRDRDYTNRYMRALNE